MPIQVEDATCCSIATRSDSDIPNHPVWRKTSRPTNQRPGVCNWSSSGNPKLFPKLGSCGISQLLPNLIQMSQLPTYPNCCQTWSGIAWEIPPKSPTCLAYVQISGAHPKVPQSCHDQIAGWVAAIELFCLVLVLKIICSHGNQSLYLKLGLKYGMLP